MNHRDVLDFWFGADPTVFQDRWFKRSEVFDAECRERFALVHEAAIDGALDAWTETAEGALALVIVLDQLGRNMHRGSFLAFAGDAHARGIARQAIARGFDRALTPVQRVFLYLPFEHSEDIADQDRSVALFESLRGSVAEGTIDYAHRHRDVIVQFGRFPHRNAALGRPSTPAEHAWLDAGGGF